VNSDKLSTPYAGLKLLKTPESIEFVDSQYVQDVDKLLLIFIVIECGKKCYFVL
jgi:hypothetical protein